MWHSRPQLRSVPSVQTQCPQWSAFLRALRETFAPSAFGLLPFTSAVRNHLRLTSLGNITSAGPEMPHITQHDETVSSRGVRAAYESIQGELFEIDR